MIKKTTIAEAKIIRGMLTSRYAALLEFRVCYAAKFKPVANARQANKANETLKELLDLRQSIQSINLAIAKKYTQQSPNAFFNGLFTMAEVSTYISELKEIKVLVTTIAEQWRLAAEESEDNNKWVAEKVAKKLVNSRPKSRKVFDENFKIFMEKVRSVTICPPRLEERMRFLLEEAEDNIVMAQTAMSKYDAKAKIKFYVPGE